MVISKSNPRSLELLGLLLVALLLASWGGGPYYHPDTVVPRALHILAHRGAPDFYNYPALVLYLNAALYGLLILVCAPFQSMSASEVMLRIQQDGVFPNGMSLALPAMLMALMWSLLGVVATYRMALLLTRHRAMAFIAGLITATSPLWVSESRFATVDMPMTVCLMWAMEAVVGCAVAETAPTRRDVLRLGALAGLAIAAKYTAVLVMVPALDVLRQRFRPTNEHRDAMIRCLVAAAVVFLILNPFAILHVGSFLHDALDEVSHGMRGHFGWQHSQGHLYHLQVSLGHALGGILLLWAAIGLWVLQGDAEHPRLVRRVIAIFVLTYYAVVGGSKLAFERYMLPLIPWLSILVAFAWTRLMRGAAERVGIWQRWALLAIALVSWVTPNVMTSVRMGQVLTRGDTRADLRGWWLKVPRLQETSMGGGSYVQVVSPVPLEIDERRLATNVPDVLVLDSFSHDRYLYDERRGRRFEFRQADYVGGRVLILTPFRVLKQAVPFSPQSVYGPYLPDLGQRREAGPYIECYVRSDSLAAVWEAAARSAGVAVEARPSGQGYYFTHFSRAREE